MCLLSMAVYCSPLCRSETSHHTTRNFWEFHLDIRPITESFLCGYLHSKISGQSSIRKEV
ncbi:MAG: hypothetical protein ACTMUP_07350 [cyanobacterium endosymbiont of Rhopalodia musculus]